MIGWQTREAERYPFLYVNAGAATLLYPRIAIGSGSDATIDSAANQGLALGAGRWYLDEIELVTVNNFAATAITLVTGAAFSSYATLKTLNTTLVAGRNRIMFRQLVGAHVIPDGHLVGIGIDPTSNHGQVNGTAIFRMV